MERDSHPDFERRRALRILGGSAAASVAGLFGHDVVAAPSTGKPGMVPRRKLGKTGAEVSILAIGGYHLGSVSSDAEATKLIHAALDAGINFFDNAWEYHDGKSEERLGNALVGKRKQAFVMTKVCTHGRGKGEAMKQLEQSLERLKTDHIDLWQVHEVVYDNDPELHYAKGGVLEALDLAKKQGKVRFVGFTGHKDPSLHLAMLEKGYAFDTVQMPLNAFDASFRSFENKVLPAVNARGMAAIGMKSLCGEGDPVRTGVVTAEEALRYAMSLPVASTVSGIDSMKILEQNLKVARDFKPMTVDEMKALRARLQKVAADGRYELYKTSLHFDGKPGREQHGFPPASKQPL